MASPSRAEELYRRLGPVLFARANRVLKDDKKAEALIDDVIRELAKLDSKLTDAELLRHGREQVERKCGSQVDSLRPT